MGVVAAANFNKIDVIGHAFASTAGQSNVTLTLPFQSDYDIVLFIVYENSTTNRPTITGFSELHSDNGTFNGSGCTRVLMSGNASGTTITIPNDATYNGVCAAAMIFSSTRCTFSPYGGSWSFYTADTTTSVTGTGNFDFFCGMCNMDGGGTELYDGWTVDNDWTSGGAGNQGKNNATYGDNTVEYTGAVAGRAAQNLWRPWSNVNTPALTLYRPEDSGVTETSGTQYTFFYVTSDTT